MREKRKAPPAAYIMQCKIQLLLRPNCNIPVPFKCKSSAILEFTEIVAILQENPLKCTNKTGIVKFLF